MDAKTEKKNKHKCAFDGCDKKLDLVTRITNKCNCEKTFCSAHKPSSSHGCTFDYRAVSSKLLEETLTKVVASKVESF
jgi:hypothetical protein